MQSAHHLLLPLRLAAGLQRGAEPGEHVREFGRELRNGATSLELHLDLTGDGGGISVRSVDDLARVLDGVLLPSA